MVKDLDMEELKGTRKRRSLRRAKTVNDSTDMKSGSSDDTMASGGDQKPVTTVSPAADPTVTTKRKHRPKLWDSFLSKTRRIRIRKNKGHDAPLEVRSSSQPNIPSVGSTPTHESFNKSFPVVNGFEHQRKSSRDPTNRDRGDTESLRRSYEQRQSYSNFSGDSLHDSSVNVHKPFIDADSYGDLLDNFEDNNNTTTRQMEGRLHHRALSDPYLTPEVQVRRMEPGVSFEDQIKGIDSKYSQEGLDEQLEENIPVIENTGSQVSKSVDSLLAVASSVTMPPAYAELLASNSMRGRRGEQGTSLALTPSTTAITSSTIGGSINGPVRRHSYDVSSNDININSDDPQFLDGQDGAKGGDADNILMMTSSSPEASPVRRAAQKRASEQEVAAHNFGVASSWTSGVKSEYRDRRRRQMTMSTEKDSMEYISDIEDNLSSIAGDCDSRIVVISEDNESPMFYPSSTPEFVSGHGRSQESHSHLQTRTANHPFYMLNVTLKEGRDLVIRDSCGTSDPYVKFKYGGKQVHKSRTILKNLNPKWDEQFTIPVDDISKPVNVKVFDYDRAWNDDPMGVADIDISTLETNKEVELKLLLCERGKSDYMGYLLVNCNLVPKSEEDKDQFFRRSTVRSTDSQSKKLKMQQWSGIVNIVLIEGSHLVPMDDNGLSDPYVKFKLGSEKYRSKFKAKTLNPRWLEQFDLRLYDEQLAQLEITVFDHDTRGKDDFMGRAVVDISQLDREKTHEIEQSLEDGAGTIKILLTISGMYGAETSSDLSCYTPSSKDKEALVRKYGLLNSFSNMGDVGHLQVKVFRAHGLHAADFGGFSDPFCVVELVNDRVQTQTEYKTLNPEWAKVFNFPVKDIHSILEVTVYDEDRNKKTEFLGKIAIPLLRIRNGERRWYALKDKKLLHKTKGAILLEMDVIFNQMKAAIRTVNPREEKFMVPEQKFKISVMKQNVNRLTQLIGVFMETGRFIQSCFDWQSPPRTITAFMVYLVIVWNFELYMLPISLLLVFMKNLLVAQIIGSFRREPVEDEYPEEDDDEEDEDKEKTEEKKSIMERYHAIQEVCLQVQCGIDSIASLGERVKNTFNWSVPWMSALAVVALAGAAIVLFYIPLRVLLLLWGINKFTKKLRKPNALSNNELLDYLSRIPSDNELIHYRELRPDIPANTVSTKKKRS